MHEDDGFAFVEVREHGREEGIPEVDAVVVGEEGDAVGVELVERAVDFGDALLDQREGNGGEEADAGGVFLLEC